MARQRRRGRARRILPNEKLRRFVFANPNVLDTVDDCSDAELEGAISRWFRFEKDLTVSMFRHASEKERLKLGVCTAAARTTRPDRLVWLDLNPTLVVSSGGLLTPTPGEDCFDCIRELHIDAEFDLATASTFIEIVAATLRLGAAQSDASHARWKKAEIVARIRDALAHCTPKGLPTHPWVAELRPAR